jgi:hypothetical protein
MLFNLRLVIFIFPEFFIIPMIRGIPKHVSHGLIEVEMLSTGPVTSQLKSKSNTSYLFTFHFLNCLFIFSSSFFNSVIQIYLLRFSISSILLIIILNLMINYLGEFIR